MFYFANRLHFHGLKILISEMEIIKKSIACTIAITCFSLLVGCSSTPEVTTFNESKYFGLGNDFDAPDDCEFSFAVTEGVPVSYRVHSSDCPVVMSMRKNGSSRLFDSQKGMDIVGTFVPNYTGFVTCEIESPEGITTVVTIEPVSN